MFCRKLENVVIYAFLVLIFWGQICICAILLAFFISAHPASEDQIIFNPGQGALKRRLHWINRPNLNRKLDWERQKKNRQKISIEVVGGCFVALGVQLYNLLADLIQPKLTHTSVRCSIPFGPPSYLSSVGNLPVREVNLQLIDFPLLIKVNLDCWSCHNLGGDCEAPGKLSRRHLYFFQGGWLVSGQLSGAHCTVQSTTVQFAWNPFH